METRSLFAARQSRLQTERLRAHTHTHTFQHYNQSSPSNFKNFVASEKFVLTAAVDSGIESVAPLLDDPLPVVNHFLGQSKDPTECTKEDSKDICGFTRTQMAMKSDFLILTNISKQDTAIGENRA